MNKALPLLLFFCVCYTLDAVAQTDSSGAKSTVPVELYTLDGGHLYFNNMGIFYDTGEHEGEKGEMAVPCYLIHHGKDWLLWDTGNGDDIHAHKDGVVKIGIHFTVAKTLKEQLAQLNLTPDDITRFEEILNKYSQSGKAIEEGLPIVYYVASKLHLSSDYFGDLIKKPEYQHRNRYRINCMRLPKKRYLTLANRPEKYIMN